VTSERVACRVQINLPDGSGVSMDPEFVNRHQRIVHAGENCFFILLNLPLPAPLPEDAWLGYDIFLKTAQDKDWISIRQWGQDLCYPHAITPGFVVKSRLDKILHGSCRKPHHPSDDGLARADQLLASAEFAVTDWPALLVLTGDQIYADDVAGPMLVAIHRLIQRLHLPAEALSGDDFPLIKDLHGESAAYYQRQNLLPITVAEGPLAEVLYVGVKKPVFTSDHARNHLITLAEVLAMYLLVWSPECWKLITLQMPEDIPVESRQDYQQEKQFIEKFVASLPNVRRVLAHLPVAMIFDDHDVTDDWNLTLGWECTAYQHPFSKRIIGNALIGYLVCQGWGNSPEKFSDELITNVQGAMSEPSSQTHELLIDQLLAFADWHYEWPGQPSLVVLDTRTHRWRSERSSNLPSGLMDWEALSELQQSMLDKDSVVMVSPAPVFGVKLIETIQRVFTWFGKPLMVDAENWMAHSGAAYALLNMFQHSRTPQHFVILSGDVHYSFFYRVQLRGRRQGPEIWQITSSGISNEFPKSLIEIFDRLDRWLYAPWSPLNWFTKRRGMKVIPHKPENAAAGERLVNSAGLGLVELAADGTPMKVAQLCSSGEDIEFVMDKTNTRWE